MKIDDSAWTTSLSQGIREALLKEGQHYIVVRNDEQERMGESAVKALATTLRRTPNITFVRPTESTEDFLDAGIDLEEPITAQ
ncbi:MAG: hypothetical protein AAB490_05930 [Patescibacteria group bacterium]